MHGIQDRAINLIYQAGIDELVRGTQISHNRWLTVRHRKARMSTEEMEALISLFPEYAYWIATGKTAPEIGQISPEDAKD